MGIQTHFHVNEKCGIFPKITPISREKVVQKTENIEINIVLQQQCALFA
jgi:hypothetical protein